MLITLLAFAFALKISHCVSLICIVVGICTVAFGTKCKKICVLFTLVTIFFVISTCIAILFLSNLHNIPAIAIMNMCTYTGFALQLFQYRLHTVPLIWVCCLASYLSDVVHTISTYYKYVFYMSCYTIKQQFGYRYLVALCLCTWMGITSSCGIGILLVFALVCFRKRVTKSLVLKCAFTIPYISMPLGEQTIKQTVTYDTNPAVLKPRTTVKRQRSVGKENACQGDNIPPSKRGRKNKNIVDEHRCGSCTVWLQTGSNEKLLKFHNINKGRARHPGDKSVQFSMFLSCNGVHNILLRPDSCLCEGCYRDCMRGEGKPRWVSLSKHLICNHCFVCCQGNKDCSCESISEWGPTQYFHDDSEYERWLDYFRCKNKVEHDKKKHNICKAHYAHMKKVISSRVCKICECDSNSECEWVLGKTLLDELGEAAVDVASHDWVCDKCFNVVVYPKISRNTTHKFATAREGALDYTLKILAEDGACLAKSIMDKYIELLNAEYDLSDIPDTECLNYKTLLKINIEAKGYMCYWQSKKLGLMYYNPEIVKDEKCLELVYKLLNRKDTSATLPDTDRIRNMVKRQAALFPGSSKFDYRTLFEEGKESILDKYFDKELMDTIDSITTSDWSIRSSKPSETHTHDRKLKCMMISAIMANNMDPRKCFLQTLVGLACYAQGLRDKGMQLLNCFGVTSSIFHIRQHGSFWAKVRSIIKELNPISFWRVTFDNLDFRIKFAKKLSSGSHLKRMLHLLTSQVSFRRNSSEQFNDTKQTLSVKELKEDHFLLNNDNTEWKKFCDSTYKINDSERHEETEQPLLTKLEKHMQHWTPEGSDKVVYATVTEAHSGSIDNVSSYLYKLMKDLHIGDSDYPKYALVGGDQQTYVIKK